MSNRTRQQFCQGCGFPMNNDTNDDGLCTDCISDTKEGLEFEQKQFCPWLEEEL